MVTQISDEASQFRHGVATSFLANSPFSQKPWIAELWENCAWTRICANCQKINKTISVSQPRKERAGEKTQTLRGIFGVTFTSCNCKHATRRGVTISGGRVELKDHFTFFFFSTKHQTYRWNGALNAKLFGHKGVKVIKSWGTCAPLYTKR